MCRSRGGDSKASSPLSFLALPLRILATEPFDWAMRRRGHQADYSARSSEHTNARWNKFIIDADSEAFAGMSEHEAKGFWTSGAGHGATGEQINKHDDREKYDQWVICVFLGRSQCYHDQSQLMNGGKEGLYFPESATK